MVTAIVLIKAEIQRIPEVAEVIAQIPAVSEVYSITGDYDLVAIVRVRAHDELADVIPGGLNKVPGVSATQTHIADSGPKSEKAHISILSSDQTGQTVVVLDIGQTWAVMDPDGWLNDGDAVTIKRGQFGSYLMFVPSNHSYHVRRLK